MKKMIFTAALLVMPLVLYADQTPINPANACQTLACARAHIDTIDQQLVNLITERMDYFKRAQELKGESLPAHDSAREATVLNNAGVQAEKLGYPATTVQAIFKIILEQSRQYEMDKNQKVLRVGTTGEYPPLTYYDPKTKQFSGIDIGNALALGKYLGRKVEFVKTSWSSLSEDLMNGKFDIAVGGISATPEREQKFFLSQPVMTDSKVPLALCKNIEKCDTLEKMNQPEIRVVENKGTLNEQLAKQIFPKAQLISVENNTDTITFLLMNKADLMIADKTEALYRKKTMPDFCIIDPEHPLTTSNKVYLVPKTDEKLLDQVNHWLKSLDKKLK